jgi:FAD/FMN-containing dehydrogenase
MRRRDFLRTAALLPLLSSGGLHTWTAEQRVSQPQRRVRPGDPLWPSDARWSHLREAVGGRLARVRSPLAECGTAPEGAACRAVLDGLTNPFYLGDHPALTQSSGWAGAWTSAPSVYAVTAEQTSDVVAAVNFAREHHLRLVVKGGGHSYQGTSSSADSLLVWTRRMDDVVLHDAFVPEGAAGRLAAQPAVSVGAGAIWGRVYQAVTTEGGRYVQGGGCTTVGVAGLVQSGGFGSFSKRFGLAAAGLLEAEVVTADGTVRIANPFIHPDLFWALRGGGGGSYGVVTRLTLRTHDLPETIGGVFGRIQAASEADYRPLVARILVFYRERLLNPHWGEQIRFEPGNAVSLRLVFQGLSREEVQEVWQPLLDWVEGKREYAWTSEPTIIAAPARRLWDAHYLQSELPGLSQADERPGAPPTDYAWAGDREEAGQFLHAYRSLWLPASLLEEDRLPDLVNALATGSEHWSIALHLNKGLAGAPAEAIEAARDTAVNPAVLDAFALAIVAANAPHAFPGTLGRSPDLARAEREAGAVGRAVRGLAELVPRPASYVAESDYFERDWQRSFWGENHARLAAVKRRYDPAGLFFVHHGVGSEEWSADGFTPVAEIERPHARQVGDEM